MLNDYKSKELSGREYFNFENNKIGSNILDFWKWNQSDLVENRNRGILTEFIVKEALQIKNESRLEWDDYDLIDKDDIKIEIKSAGYIQSWDQKKYSEIRFGISPNRRNYDKATGVVLPKRLSDIYVFCLLHHKDEKTIDPMKLEQWTFYIVKTSTLNNDLAEQKSIGLNTLKSIDHVECSYNELKGEYEKLVYGIKRV